MKILMVCLGNICRSPMAAGVLRKKIEEQNLNDLIEVESAGTISIHQGEHPDSRAIKIARINNIDISRLHARHFSVEDFDLFDKIIVMDKSNFAAILSLVRNDGDKQKVEMLLNYCNPGSNESLSDPYFGDMDGFDDVFILIDRACDGIVDSLKKEILK